MTEPARHPAKFSAPILEAIDARVRDGERLLDPFAGIGKIHELAPRVDTVGIEIEPEWAAAHPRNVVGDALNLPFDSNSFDVVATSPTYGNRMADHHEARDASRRMTYRHALGRSLHSKNSGQLHWGRDYRLFHQLAWLEARRVLKPGGRLVLNISNHVRKGEIQRVVEWHTNVLLGETRLTLLEVEPVQTRRLRYGANRELRVSHEFVLVFGK